MPMLLLRPLGAVAALVMLAAPGLAQQPNDDQISAIRSSCRSDFMAHCAGVPRGGAEALRCLRQNLAQLSPACQTAVNAATPKSAPPAAPAAAPAAVPPPASAPAAPAPAASAPAAAPASPATASAPPASPPAPAARVPAVPPQKRVAMPAKPVPAAPPLPAAARPAPPAAQPTALGPIPPLPPRARLAILRACGAEHQALCANVPAGGGRIIECLAANGAALSPGCRAAILSAR